MYPCKISIPIGKRSRSNVLNQKSQTFVNTLAFKDYEANETIEPISSVSKGSGFSKYENGNFGIFDIGIFMKEKYKLPNGLRSGLRRPFI